MEINSFIEIITYTKSQFDAALNHLTIEDMNVSGLQGSWSVKDILRHITWYEKEMVQVIRSRSLNGSDWWGLSLNERNARIYDENKNRPGEDILKEYQEVFQELLSALKELQDDDLNLSSRFANLPDGWIPWQLIASNTFDHYPHHLDGIKRWIKEC